MPADRREFILGDLEELHATWTDRHGRRAADWFYIEAVLASLLERIGNRGRPDPGEGKHAPAPGPRRPVAHRLFHDLRLAGRSLRRSPRFTILAVLTLGLGIGANTALFSVVHGVFLRPLPFPDADRVVHLAWRGSHWLSSYVPAFKVRFWEERTRAFEALTTWRETTLTLGDVERGEAVDALRVPHTFLLVTGFEPRLGRGMTEAEDQPGGPDVVVVGYDLWQRRWGGDRSLLGRAIRLDGRPHTVVGILPPEFALPQAEHDPGTIELLVPLRLVADPTDEAEDWPILARLEDGIDRDEAAADVRRVSRDFAAEHPDLMNSDDRGMAIASYRELYTRDVGPALWVLMWATVLVLLISCANVAALLLARGQARRGELAVRTALGAGRIQIAGQLMMESLLLALLASGLGLLLARLGVIALMGLYPGRLPRSEWIGLNGTVVVYTMLAALATGAVFGVAAAVPTLRAAAGRGVAGLLREGGRSGSRRGLLRPGLVCVESAVSFVLLVGAGLLVATLIEITAVDPGWDLDGLWVVRGPDDAARGEMLDAARRVPGIAGAATASSAPFERGINIPVTIQPRLADAGTVEWRSISPTYPEVLGIRLLRGRALTEVDASGAAPVALVNEAFVRRWFPGEDPVGRRIEIGRYGERYSRPELDVGGTEIVGVVADVRERSLKDEPSATVLVPSAQAPGILARPPVLLVRLATDEAIPHLRQALADLSGFAGTAPPPVQSMRELLAEDLARERFNALLMGTFAAVALALTTFGIYGVVSYGVRQRKQEIAIRMALGAPRRGVIGQVVGQGVQPVALGMLLGAAVSALLVRFIAGLLWGIRPTDATTVVAVAAVAALLVLVGLISSWIPAREAASVDPQRALAPE